jgi:hypothetical protein
MKWEAYSIFPIKVSKIVLIPKGNDSDQKSHYPDTDEDGRSLPLSWTDVAKREDDDQKLLQSQEGQQQDGDFRGQHGQEAHETALHAVHPQQRVLLILPSVFEVEKANGEQVNAHQAVGTCGRIHAVHVGGSQYLVWAF